MAGWDCHAHLFGPYDRFPLSPDRSYTPPPATEHAYQTLLERLDLSHGVLVHPSAYGDDFSLLLHALEQHANLRGVVVLRAGNPVSLATLRRRGVRAARFSHRSGPGANFAGSASFDDLMALAPRLADEGLHAELWTDTAALPGIVPALRRMPVPVVIDHMGGFDPGEGVTSPGFQALLSLLGEGRVVVKLCAYRNVLASRRWALAQPFHEALLRANPEGLVWGSDWPHLRVDPAPDAGELLALCRSWTAEPEALRLILETNPTRLYA